MIEIIIGLIIFILLLGLGTFITMKIIKKIKKKNEYEKNIPKDILNKFENIEKEFERRNLETNGKCNPYQVLWETARGKDGIKTKLGRTEQNVIGGKLPEQFSRQKGIQSESIKGDEKNIGQPKSTKPNSFRNIFSRRNRN